eukprot:jgi/Ulvmu1/10820/UM069_0056.1
MVQILLGATLLSLVASAFGCSCLTTPPLSECAVLENQAALLVTVKCVKSLQCDEFSGTAVADVMIDKVFQDNTNLTLTNGTMVTIKSRLESSLCGFGMSFRPATQLIVFAGIPAPPFNPDGDGEGVVIVPDDDLELLADDDDAPTAARRLMQSTSVVIRASSGENTSTFDVIADVGDADVENLFSDGTVCDVMTADLETSLCSGNLFSPSMQNITTLMMGCSSAA